MPITERTPKQCFERFREHLAQLFAKVITPTVHLQARSIGSTVTLGMWRGADLIAFPIETTHGPLFFYFSQGLRAVEDGKGFRLETLNYYYRLLRADDDPIVRWEYDRHPTANERYARHHLHIHGSAQVSDTRTIDLKDLHTPTGWVLIEEVLRFLITDLGVKPYCGEQWHELLENSETAFYEQFTSRRRLPPMKRPDEKK